MRQQQSAYAWASSEELLTQTLLQHAANTCGLPVAAPRGMLTRPARVAGVSTTHKTALRQRNAYAFQRLIENAETRTSKPFSSFPSLCAFFQMIL